MSLAPDPKVFVVEDESLVRAGLCATIGDAGWTVQGLDSCEAFLKAYRPGVQTCLVLDMHLPGMGGLELLDRIAQLDHGPEVVVVSGSSRLSEAVQALKAGACDFIEKPVAPDTLLASITSALARSRHADKAAAQRHVAIDHISSLTPRQHQIMERVLAGEPSKNIAADLGISQRTVENHRAAIMHKTGAHSLPDLSRLVMCNRCVLAS
jgi:two-component system CheB/CheR fusion protein